MKSWSVRLGELTIQRMVIRSAYIPIWRLSGNQISSHPLSHLRIRMNINYEYVLTDSRVVQLYILNVIFICVTTNVRWVSQQISLQLYHQLFNYIWFSKTKPQRCYWRNLSKRSVDSSQVPTTQKPLVSESISLFQSLEVRQESDRKDVSNPSEQSKYWDKEKTWIGIKRNPETLQIAIWK